MSQANEQQQEQKQPQMVHVGDLYIVKNGEQILGVETVFTENVLNKQGAVLVLDNLKGALNSTGWTMNTVMRVQDREQGDAQVDTQASVSSDTGTEGAGKKQRKKVQADAE